MDASTRPNKESEAAEIDVRPSDPMVIALWSALSAERCARDERTARLRAMRLTAGEDLETT